MSAATSSSSSQVAVSIDTIADDELILYNFPSKLGEVWRIVTTFSLTDKKNTIRWLDALGKGTVLRLRGQLLPLPGSGKRRLLVEVEVVHYTVDHGSLPNDPCRGIWVQAANTVYYKLQDSAADNYRLYGTRMSTMLFDYFKLLDEIVAIRDKKSGRTGSAGEITDTVQQIRERCEGTERSFSLENIGNNAEFILENISTIGFPLGSQFINSLRSLGNLSEVPNPSNKDKYAPKKRG